MEHVEVGMSSPVLLRDVLGEREHPEKHDREGHARDGRYFLREEVDHAEGKQDERDEAEAYGNFYFADLEIERYAKFAFARLLVAKHEHSQTLHGEAPHHTERIGLTQDEDVATAEKDR